MSDLLSAAWPLSRLGEAVETLALRAGLRPIELDTTLAQVTHPAPIAAELDRWIDTVCKGLDVEAESVYVLGSDLGNLLRNGGPALLRYRYADEDYLLLLLGATNKTVRLTGPDGRVVSIPLEALYTTLVADYAQPIVDELEGLLEQAAIPEAERDRLIASLAQERIASIPFGDCWLLRMPAAKSFRLQLFHARLPLRLGYALAVVAVMYCIEAGSWTVIGKGALEGRLDHGWLIAWALLLLLAVPLRLGGAWLQSSFAVDLGRLLKQRLLAGALNMEVDEVRRRGAGQLLSQVIESQALESLSLNGGFAVLMAVIELSVAAPILLVGAGGWTHLGLLVAWVGCMTLCGWRYYARLRTWTTKRLDLTHDLVERLVGHRTRLVQEAHATRHNDEDQQLERYLLTSSAYDKAFVRLAGGLPRGWLALGLFGLAPEFALGNADAVELAIGLGGVLLAYRACGDLQTALASLSRALVAWKEVSPLFVAAGRVSRINAMPLYSERGTTECQAETANQVLIEARNLIFQHTEQHTPTLKTCDLTIRRGDRILLEGPSGSGKSTLAALLTGLRPSAGGLLLLEGLDRASLGTHWRRRSTAAPQFHENHILSGTFAFNLLMGRRWPATPKDLAIAEELCHELGLGELLSRMPSALMQMVGETGWQLSHGERSRVFLARALLQQADLVVLDECFAALDPQTLMQCLRCALRRAPTLMVIAHP